MYTLDFETKPIENGAPHPPRPVGLAYIKPNGDKGYLAWGHPTENNCTVLAAEDLLDEAWRHPMLFHNAKFDVAVAMHWFRKPYPARVLNVHDTMFMAYLDDPRRSSLHLKDLAAQLLDMPPDEQRDLHEWLKEHYPPARRAKKNWGKYIAEGPGGLVGRYAIGDVVRTLGLYEYFNPIIEDFGMTNAYQREQRLLPVILDMERQGVRISATVHDEYETQQARLDKLETFIHKKLGVDAETNLGHGPTLYKAMQDKKLVDEKKVRKTELGNPKTGRDEVGIWCRDRRLVEALEMRSRLVKVIGTYLRPWSEAQAAYGRFFPYFNQTRNPEDMGTRTGRLSSNFQQVPREPDEDVDVPYLRNFILPEAGEVINARDFSSQELRILGHFAEGKLLRQYHKDPNLDVHQWVRDLIFDMVGLDLKRSPVKQANFLQIYGGGAPALSRNIPCELDVAKEILAAHKIALPEIKELSKEIQRILVEDNELIRTWGDRLYDVEYGPSKHSDEIEPLYYKMINVLIQGSAADQTKQLMIDYHTHPDRRGRIMLQVHDELLTSVSKQHQKQDMCLLRDLMNSDEGWDVPMRSDGKTGTTWGGAVKYNDRRCK